MTDKPRIAQIKVPKPGVALPEFWHSGRHESDREKITGWMKFIPADKQQAAADEYQRIFMTEPKQPRGKANTYLHGVAKEYRDLRFK